MDKIYFWILILFFIVLILDFSDKYMKKRRENFNNIDFNNETISDSTIPKYFEENRVYEYEPPYTSNAVNINTSPNSLNFKNFGTNGITPPFLKCPSCNLQFNCSNYPYDVDSQNESVCTSCNNKISVNDNNYPVYAKAVGRPRLCQNLK
jgi:hypothetical protein